MAVFFKIAESVNKGILYIHNHVDSDNSYFNFRGEVGSNDRPDNTDSGQYWVASSNPTIDLKPMPIYNAFSSSLLGNIGIFTETNGGTLIGGVTFLSTKYNGKLLFAPSGANPANFNIRLTNFDGTLTNFYVCYLTDTPEVGLVAIENINQPPANTITTWTITELAQNAPLGSQ